jgi:hypothetical protein
LLYLRCRFVLSVWAFVAAVCFKITVPGWASTVVPIYFICGIQMLCVGVIGEYIGKIYLETKRRPRLIIECMTRSNQSANQDRTAFEPPTRERKA